MEDGCDKPGQEFLFTGSGLLSWLPLSCWQEVVNRNRLIVEKDLIATVY